MPIADLYSSRTARSQETNDVWQYDAIPDKLRVQVAHIIEGAMGEPTAYEHGSRAYYDFINRTVAHEHGRDTLTGQSRQPRQPEPENEVNACVRNEHHVLIWLDVVELTFRVIERDRGRLNDHGRSMAEITIPADEAVAELNERFRRAGFGYRYERGDIVRIDDEFLHQEATRPARALLSDPGFSGASDEFRAAHEHLKAGETKDCCVDALNALESTMKAICDAKGWPHEKGARATDLVKILRREKLFPEYADQSIEQLLVTLKSGLPSCETDRRSRTGRGAGRAADLRRGLCAEPLRLEDLLLSRSLQGF